MKRFFGKVDLFAPLLADIFYRGYSHVALTLI